MPRTAHLLALPLASALFLAAAGATPAHAAAPAVLFEPAPGSTPSAQGWTFLTDPLFVARATQTAGPAGTTLDSTAVMSEKAGWFSSVPPLRRHPRQPALDAQAGFVFSFQARLLSEAHVSPDRAGFSIIATASNLGSIELGFWTNEVWAQSGADFRHAEGAAFDTTAANTLYDLEIAGQSYRLSANGTLLLSGNLRRYDSFGAPYNIPEFLFLGDDTTSASASTAVGRITVSPLPRLAITRAARGLTLAVEADSGRTVVFERTLPGTDSVWQTAGTVVAEGGIARLVLPPPDTAAAVFRARLR